MSDSEKKRFMVATPTPLNEYEENLVKFAEEVLGLELLPHQKKILEKLSKGASFKIIPKRGLKDPSIRRILTEYRNKLSASTDFFYFWDNELGWVHVSEKEKLKEAYERFKEEIKQNE